MFDYVNIFIFWKKKKKKKRLIDIGQFEQLGLVHSMQMSFWAPFSFKKIFILNLWNVLWASFLKIFPLKEWMLSSNLSHWSRCVFERYKYWGKIFSTKECCTLDVFFFNVNGPYTSKKWMFPNQELDNRDVHWTESKMAFRSLFLHLILRPYQISHWDRSRNWVPHSIFWKSSDINYYYWKLLIK